MTEYDIPTDATVHDCPYCDRPFADEQLRDLHRGVDHYDRLDDDERAAYEDAYETEDETIRRYRIIALGVLVLLYFGLLMTYALV